MYAHIEPLTSRPGPPPRSASAVGWRDRSARFDGPAATRITLFDGTPGPATDIYQVMAIETGTAGGQQPPTPGWRIWTAPGPRSRRLRKISPESSGSAGRP